jgi:hypothetical protein
MPWCEGCDRFYNPNTLTESGQCPEGHHVADPVGEDDPKIPWHFWLLVIGLVLYLGYRAFQGLEWLFS